MKHEFEKISFLNLLRAMLAYHVLFLVCLSLSSLLLAVLPFEIYSNYQTLPRPDKIFNESNVFGEFSKAFYYYIFLCLISLATIFDLISQSGTYLLMLVPTSISMYLILLSKKKSFWVNWGSVMLIHTIIVTCYLVIMYLVRRASLTICALLFSCFTIAASISTIWLIRHLERITLEDDI